MEAPDHTVRNDRAVQLLHALGYLYGSHGQTKRGLALLLIAARLSPHNIGVLRTLAHAFLADGSPHLAMAVIDRLRSMEGAEHPVNDLLTSHALWAAGREIEARRCFRDFLDRRRIDAHA
jgi:type III secretion protein Y